MATPKPTRTSRLRGWLWLLLPVAVFVSAAVGAAQRDRVPTRRDWQAAVEAVRARLKPGDGVTWAPYTQGEGRLFFGDLPVFHTRDLATADLARYDRVFVLGALGYDAAPLLAPRGDAPVHRLAEGGRQTFGRVTVDEVEVAGPKVTGDLLATLDRATVRRRYTDGRERLCDFWSGQGWHCEPKAAPELVRQCLGESVAARLARHDRKQRSPDQLDADCGLDPELHVSRDVRLIGDTPRHCVWFHPAAGATVQLEWTEAPAAEVLVIDEGFADPMVADNYARELHVSPARLRVLRAGTELGALEIPAQKGWRRHELPLPAGASAAPITFEIASASDRDAHFCFDPTLRMRSRTPSGGAP